MEADRPTLHDRVLFAAEVGPFTLQHNFFFKGHTRNFGGDGFDLFWLNSALFRHRIGGVFLVQITRRQKMHHRSVGDARMAVRGV